MYDVPLNRLPYAGSLSYRQLDAISTFNVPMLDIEHSLIGRLAIDHGKAGTCTAPADDQSRVPPRPSAVYYVLQIADTTSTVSRRSS